MNQGIRYIAAAVAMLGAIGLANAQGGGGAGGGGGSGTPATGSGTPGSGTSTAPTGGTNNGMSSGKTSTTTNTGNSADVGAEIRSSPPAAGTSTPSHKKKSHTRRAHPPSNAASVSGGSQAG